MLNGYLLTLASLILLGGSLGDRFGRRRMFVDRLRLVHRRVAVVRGRAEPGLLVVARLLQGVGGALLTPGSLAMIEASFRPADRATAIGAWSGLGGVVTAIGPLLGGLLVERRVVAGDLRHQPAARDLRRAAGQPPRARDA